VIEATCPRTSAVRLHPPHVCIILTRSTPRMAVGWGITVPAHPEDRVSATWAGALCLACNPRRRRCTTRGGGLHTRRSSVPVCRPCGCAGRRVGRISTSELTPFLVPPRRYRLLVRWSLRADARTPTTCGDGAVEGGARRWARPACLVVFPPRTCSVVGTVRGGATGVASRCPPASGVGAEGARARAVVPPSVIDLRRRRRIRPPSMSGSSAPARRQDRVVCTASPSCLSPYQSPLLPPPPFCCRWVVRLCWASAIGRRLAP